MRPDADGLVFRIEAMNTILRINHEGAPDRVVFLNVRYAVLDEDPATKNWRLTLVVGTTKKIVLLTRCEWQHILASLEDFFDEMGDPRTRECLRLFRRQVLDDIMKREGSETLAEESSGDRVYDLICAADRCRSEIVLCLMGRPGIGKTEAVERFARDHNRKVVHIIASQIMPNEVSGMTMPNQETHSMDVFDHYRLSHMKDGDILFLDELLKGQQQVLNACLTMIQERRLMSGTKLPDVLVIAAANPLASPKMLPLEIRQRFMFVSVEWRKSKWVDYMVEKRGFPRTKMLVDVADLVANRMDKDSDWNTITPRTMTKIMVWMRELGKRDEAMLSLLFKDYNLSDSDVELIRFASIGHKEDDLYRVAYKINDIVGMNHGNGGPGVEPARDEIMAMVGDILKGDDVDLKDLLEKLQCLPEWDDIATELSKAPLVQQDPQY